MRCYASAALVPAVGDRELTAGRGARKSDVDVPAEENMAETAPLKAFWQPG